MHPHMQIRQARSWRKCSAGGGAKPACAITLEGQKPYFVMHVSRLMILLGAVAPKESHVKCFIWGTLPPCPLQVRA